jgi:hypothetical protein
MDNRRLRSAAVIAGWVSAEIARGKLLHPMLAAETKKAMRLRGPLAAV